MVLPEARIIHVRRNPVDVCFSIFRRDFAKAYRLATSFEDLGHYYGEYARLAAHCERMLGERCLSVGYEELKQDFAGAARRLVAHCGLKWSDACLEFHKHRRIVSTFSAVQVRRPIYDAPSAVSRYGAHLKPLIESLTAAGVDPATGRYFGEP